MPNPPARGDRVCAGGRRACDRRPRRTPGLVDTTGTGRPRCLAGPKGRPFLAWLGRDQLLAAAGASLTRYGLSGHEAAARTVSTGRPVVGLDASPDGDVWSSRSAARRPRPSSRRRRPASTRQRRRWRRGHAPSSARPRAGAMAVAAPSEPAAASRRPRTEPMLTVGHEWFAAPCRRFRERRSERADARWTSSPPARGDPRLGGRSCRPPAGEMRLARILDLFEEHVYAGEITQDGRYVHHESPGAIGSLIGGPLPAASSRGRSGSRGSRLRTGRSTRRSTTACCGARMPMRPIGSSASTGSHAPFEIAPARAPRPTAACSSKDHLRHHRPRAGRRPARRGE